MNDAADLLTLAVALTCEQADAMAHALGWPDTGGHKATRGNVRWSNPYRNHFCTSADDAVWQSIPPGLAEAGPLKDMLGGNCYWRVTPKGRAVLRLRLRAHKEISHG